jgi:20S proteasome alpha/beta subunit
MGASGNYAKVREFVSDGGELPLFDAGFEAFLVRDGVVYHYDGSGVMYKVEAPFHAIGSGASIAIGAMEMGATAVGAVEVASKYDIYTGGDIICKAF